MPAPFFLALVLGFLPSVNRSRGRVKAVLQTRASAFEALGAPPRWGAVRLEANYYGLTAVALGAPPRLGAVRLEANYYGLTAVALGAPPAWAQLGWKQTTTASRP